LGLSRSFQKHLCVVSQAARAGLSPRGSAQPRIRLSSPRLYTLRERFRLQFREVLKVGRIASFPPSCVLQHFQAKVTSFCLCPPGTGLGAVRHMKVFCCLWLSWVPPLSRPTISRGFFRNRALSSRLGSLGYPRPPPVVTVLGRLFAWFAPGFILGAGKIGRHSFFGSQVRHHTQRPGFPCPPSGRLYNQPNSL